MAVSLVVLYMTIAPKSLEDILILRFPHNAKLTTTISTATLFGQTG